MSREKKERTGGRKEKSCGIKKTKNDEAELLRTEYDQKVKEVNF